MHAYELHRLARRIWPRERVSQCLYTPIPGRLPRVLYYPRWQAAGVADVVRCASPWTCPVCASRIQARRYDELAETLTAHFASGGRVGMLTFTVQHVRGQSLRDVLALLRDTWSRYASGKGSLSRLPGVVGYARFLELTYGAYGWHPHYHVLLLTDGRRVGGDVLVQRWVRLVAAGGGYASERAQDVQFGGADDALAWYLSIGKLAAEATLAVNKRGRSGPSRSIWQLLEASAGDPSSAEAALLYEYLSGVAGLRSVVYSSGWSERYRAAEDDELVAPGREDAVELASLPPDAWRAIVAQDALTDVLRVARSGDADALFGLLDLLLPQSVPFSSDLYSH